MMKLFEIDLSIKYQAVASIKVFFLVKGRGKVATTVILRSLSGLFLY